MSNWVVIVIGCILSVGFLLGIMFPVQYIEWEITTFPLSPKEEMKIVTEGEFSVKTDCYNDRRCYLGNSEITNIMAYKMENRSRVSTNNLIDGVRYRLYSRTGWLLGGEKRNYYFIECIN